MVTAEIVNLRRARKSRTRQAADAQASRNRAVFGLSKAAKAVASAERDRSDVLLSAHRIGDSEGGNEGR